jgi:hypothetical protein
MPEVNYEQFVLDLSVFTDFRTRVLRATLGLMAELNEYQSVDKDDREEIISELGDILFWLTVLRYEFPGSQFVYASPFGSDLLDKTIMDDLVDTIEKATRSDLVRNQGKKTSDVVRANQLVALLYQGLINECQDFDINIDIIREHNIRKLSSRHQEVSVWLS